MIRESGNCLTRDSKMELSEPAPQPRAGRDWAPATFWVSLQAGGGYSVSYAARQGERGRALELFEATGSS